MKNRLKITKDAICVIETNKLKGLCYLRKKDESGLRKSHCEVQWEEGRAEDLDINDGI